MREKVLSVVLVLILLTTMPLMSAPLFPDVPNQIYARDAVAQLAAKGIVEGYPDGTYKGDRFLSRWEMATVIARILAKWEQMTDTFATKEDYQTLKSLCEQYKDELDAYGVRIQSLEQGYAKVGDRVTDLERITFYGNVDMIQVNQRFWGAPNVGTNVNLIAVDWTNGRLLTNGNSTSGLVKLGTKAVISPEFNAGAEFNAYYTQGDQVIDQYWGVTPPFLCNPFTSTGSAAAPGMQAANNQPFTKMVLDTFWARHEPSNTRLIVGSYWPSLIDKFVLLGARNPNVNRPYVLPFFGGNLTGTIKGTYPIDYEIMHARLGQSANYLTWATAANFTYRFNIGRFSVSFLRAVNDPNGNGSIIVADAIAIPFNTLTPIASRFWVDTRFSGAASQRTFVGPQEQNILGGSLVLNLPNDWTLTGEFASSNYNPDRSGRAAAGFSTTTTGNMWRAAVNKKLKAWEFDLEYLNVAINYDPFILAYPIAPNLPIFLPYSSYYSNYYQLHDYIKYPDNRRGLRFQAIYTFDRGKVTGNYESIEQVSASTAAQIQTVGSIEALFPMLTGTGAEKGSIKDWGMGFNYTFPSNLALNMNYFNYKIARSSTTVADDLNFDENVGLLGLGYPIDRKWTIFGNYGFVTYKGYTGATNTDFTQNIPSLGASFAMDANTLLVFNYKLYNYNDAVTSTNNWQGRQATLEVKVNF